MRNAVLVGLVALMTPAIGAADPEATAPPPAPVCHAPQDPSGAAPPPARQLLTGYGSGGFLVRTHNKEAQAFFDNGMQLGHAFAHKASIAAFEEARRLDPDCAMCAWGEAWSRGPTINYPIDRKTQKELAVIADRAASLAADGPQKERLLTQALQKRYRNGGGSGPGDLAFAQAMDAIARQYPDDNEIAVLAADAWMIPSAAKDSRKTLPRAVEILEAALKRDPSDTGAIHFYIHATEMSGFGVRALPYAEKLQGLAPSASHLVHMPSHTFFWAGWYQQAAQSNLDAVQLDLANAERLKTPVWDLSYHGHNVQFGTGAALMSGDAAGALRLSGPQLARLGEVKAADTWAQIGIGTAYFAEARFAEPDRVLALADPGGKLPYLQAMWRYARGEALARRGDAGAVRAEAAHILIDRAALKPFGGFAPQADAMVSVARLVLQGRAAMLDGRFVEAAAAYRQAAGLQESKLGRISDPPAFWYPVRRSLAAALLAAGKPQEAATEAQASLARWPADPMALVVLSRAERALGQPGQADQRLQTARRGWKGDPSQAKPALV